MPMRQTGKRIDSHSPLGPILYPRGYPTPAHSRPPLRPCFTAQCASAFPVCHLQRLFRNGVEPYMHDNKGYHSRYSALSAAGTAILEGVHPSRTHGRRKPPPEDCTWSDHVIGKLHHNTACFQVWAVRAPGLSDALTVDACTCVLACFYPGPNTYGISRV